MPMTLSALAYVSRATDKLSREKLNEIVDDAKDFNGRHELSGALVYDGFCFFQYIEGPRVRLADACARIRASRSHIILLSLIDGPVPTRRFEGWEMYYRDGIPSGIDALNWLPGQEPSGDPKRDLVANSLSYFWRTFDKELAPSGHS